MNTVAVIVIAMLLALLWLLASILHVIVEQLNGVFGRKSYTPLGGFVRAFMLLPANLLLKLFKRIA